MKKKRILTGFNCVNFDCNITITDDSDADVHSNHTSHSNLLKNTRTDKVVVYWVSFLDGVQRVLLLTQDERIAKKAVKVWTIFLSLEQTLLASTDQMFLF